MDLATVLSIVQSILTGIQTLDHLKSTFSLYQYKDELERLEKTVNIVQSVLVDADAKQGVLSHQQMIYIQELKDAIYDADDVLDEFVTLVKQRKAVFETHHKLSNKVRSFLSCFSLCIHSLSRKVMKVNKKLDDIASNSDKFLFKVDNKPKRFIKPESSSLVSQNDTIIGRGAELEKFVRMLLSADDVDQPNNITCLAIVGMGGLGKTAFAQLVYNDPRVTSAFDLKYWICVADQDQWNLTEILAKIVKELPSSNTHNNITSLEGMHLEIRKQLGGKKYLLVLDDVWTESHHRWQDFENFLEVGASGSRIVVTTRSKKTAQIVGDVRMHELQGLQEEESWRLFERMAFPPRQREIPDNDLVKLGKEIVRKCSNVPLAIRVVASLLHGEPKLKWVSFRDKELANISESDDTMDNILRLSYYQLDFSLKSCFSYCAIFPKDFVIYKEMLISLWMAQGYISNEYVGEDYILILLQRCFFQDLEMDEWGEIRRFKIHDLLHDIAEQVAKNDMYRLSRGSLNKAKKVRHLALAYGLAPEKTFNKTHIRTCIQVQNAWECSSISNHLAAGNSLAKWTCLRSLYLRNSCLTRLPESIGELLHLRCLNLSCCRYLKVLPDSLAKLVNLQTLDLSYCLCLKKLPKDVSKLLDLSTLNLTYCKKLRHMPLGMDLLTQLHTLALYVVGEESSNGKQHFAGLEGLRSMNNLKGFLEVRIGEGVYDTADYYQKNQGEGAYLRDKERLKRIHIKFTGRDDRDINREEELLEEMQPHHDLKGLKLVGYIGKKLPRWPWREDNSILFHLPNLITLNITEGCLLQSLTSLGKLPRLKYLTLDKLLRLEYMVNVKPDAPGVGKESSLFPCLEELCIREAPELKGWWPRLRPGLQNKGLIISVPVPCFAKLKSLIVSESPMLKSFPMSSSLEHVYIGYYYQSARRTNNKDEFHRFLQTFMPLDSESRLVSLDGSEPEIEIDNIDVELTTVVHRWMSTSGYLFNGAPDA